MIACAFLACLPVVAQKNNAAIHKANELYKQKNFDASQQEYSKVLATDPKNPTVNYNNGNAQFRSNKQDEAVQSYSNTIDYSKDKSIREKAFYNKGVALSKQQKLQESIDAWKESLKLDATDNDARENLEKALMEQKKQQDQQKNNNDNKDKKDKKQDQQQKQQDQKPQQQQSKLSKQQVEQLLKALQQKEKEIQQKMQKGSPSPTKPDKDW